VFAFVFAFELRLSGRYERAFVFDELLFAAARNIRGTNTAAAIPNPAIAIKRRARIPTTQSHAFRFAGGAGDT
jgi:hypothetical protein